MDESDWSDDRPLEDWEYPDEVTDDEDDEPTPTRACPMCGIDVYDDAVQCPLCGEYFTRTNRAWEGRPFWWMVLGLLGIMAVILTLTAF
jgi:predicted nucleic acid-binding Zn ribbon protein